MMTVPRWLRWFTGWAERRRANHDRIVLAALCGAGKPTGVEPLLRLTGLPAAVLCIVLERLEQGGFITSNRIDRGEQWPQRMMYQITDAGRDRTRPSHR